jgi:hypothetical protein
MSQPALVLLNASYLLPLVNAALTIDIQQFNVTFSSCLLPSPSSPPFRLPSNHHWLSINPVGYYRVKVIFPTKKNCSARGMQFRWQRTQLIS